MWTCDNIICLRFKRFEETIEESLKESTTENYFDDVTLECDSNQIITHFVLLIYSGHEIKIIYPFFGMTVRILPAFHFERVSNLSGV